MTTLATQLKYLELGSELEALLTEAELIRIYQPPFNILLKDDKSSVYLQVTKETFPKVLVTRKPKQGTKHNVVLGPFASATQLKEVLKIARKIFPWCSKTRKDNKPCFYYHLNLCPGVCIDRVSANEYQSQINELILFLKGKKKTVNQRLKIKMKQAVSTENFELAGKIRDQLKLIELVTKQSYHLQPQLITPQLQNQVSSDGIVYLQNILAEHLHLPKQLPLTRIEGYDVSNTQGTNATVSMVVFINGKPSSTYYRLFNIKTLDTPNDFAMMQEAVTRRQQHLEWGTANLTVLDGGKGQIKSVLKVWSHNTPIIGLTKNPDRLTIPLLNYQQLQQNRQTTLKQLKYAVIKLNSNHPTLKLLQQVRDESHRFAQKQHKKLRLKAMIE